MLAGRASERRQAGWDAVRPSAQGYGRSGKTPNNPDITFKIFSGTRKKNRLGMSEARLKTI